jgi:hypothetical protein
MTSPKTFFAQRQLAQLTQAHPGRSRAARPGGVPYRMWLISQRDR